MPETTPIRMPPASVPGSEPRPPTMMAMKLGMIRLSPIVGCRPEHADREHAGEAGEINAEAEIQVAQHADIDAQHGYGFEIERAGADADAEAGVVEDHETARPRPR